MPNFIISEYFLPFVEFCDRISPNQLKPKNGYIELPTAPGLGIDVNEEALKDYPGTQGVSDEEAADAFRRRAVTRDRHRKLLRLSV